MHHGSVEVPRQTLRFLCLHTADVVIVQVNVHKLLLFIHSAYGSKGRGSSCIVRVKNKKQMVDAPEITPNEC